MALNPWQINLFRHNGFMRLPDQISEAAVQRMKEAVWGNIRNLNEPLSRGEGGEIVRVSNVLEREPVFWEAATGPHVLDVLIDVLGPNIEMMRHKHNHVQLVTKAAKGGAYHHRDCLTWTNGSVSVMFFLEESTVEKGCTKVIPGSHLLPWANITGGWHKDARVNDWNVLDQEVLVEMPAGGMLMIDSLLIHSIGLNTTDQTRMSMTVGYKAHDEFGTVEDPERWLISGERRREGNKYARLLSARS